MSQPTLVRIVRLTIHPEKTTEFLRIFDQISDKIRAFEGCEYLELVQDIQFSNIFSTYSHWSSENALDSYRSSDLFETTWNKTKALFAAPPLANSYLQLRV